MSSRSAVRAKVVRHAKPGAAENKPGAAENKPGAAADRPGATADKPRPAASTSETDVSARALSLAKEIEHKRGQGRTDILTTQALQALMAAACKVYAARLEAGDELLPLQERSGVTATDVMTTASGLLRAVNLAVFELGMWQSWTGR